MKLNLEYWPLDRLIDYSRNPRKNDQVIQKMVASITEFGFTIPVLAKSDGLVIDGHLRIKAARQLKINEVPVVVADHLTDAQVKAFRLLANRSANWAEWDEELLRLELSDLKSLDVDLGLTGFDDVEISKFLDEPLVVEEDGEVDIDKSELLKEQYGVESGQLWQLGKHRLFVGDATNVEDVTRLLDGRIPLLMVTDPPYGVEYDPTWRDNINGLFGDGRRIMRGKVENDDRIDWKEAWSLFSGDVAYIWHSALKIPEIVDSVVKNDFNARSLIVWYKQHFTLMRSGYHWSHESLLYAVRNNKTAHWIGDRKQTTVWQIESLNAAGRKGLKADQEVKLGHGTQKPIECMARPIRNHDSEYVYDPFCGSGTTLIACEQLKRSCLAMEIMPNYGAMIIDRFVKQTGIEPLLL
jgi:DNA modification methylase